MMHWLEIFIHSSHSWRNKGNEAVYQLQTAAKEIGDRVIGFNGPTSLSSDERKIKAPFFEASETCKIEREHESSWMGNRN